MVGEDVECASFREVFKVFDCKVHGKQFPIKDAVTGDILPEKNAMGFHVL